MEFLVNKKLKNLAFDKMRLKSKKLGIKKFVYTKSYSKKNKRLRNKKRRKTKGQKCKINIRLKILFIFLLLFCILYNIYKFYYKNE